MKTKVLGIIILLQLSITVFAQDSKTTDSLLLRSVNVGLTYPISTNGSQAVMYRNVTSFQALVGLSGGLAGAAFTGVGNIIKENGNGAVFAGIFNTVGNNAKGAQFAGIYNGVKQKMTGAQFAGIGNSLSNGPSAVQFGGIFNSAETVHTQVAGLLNMANKVEGVQISGLINIADSSAYPIGFINLIKTGEKYIGLSTDGNLNTMLSFYSGSKKLYGILGIGYNFSSKYHIYGLQGGIGAHFFNTEKKFQLNVEALQLVQTDFKNGHCYTYALQVFPEVRITDKFNLFAGPSVNFQLDYSDGKISGLTKHHFWTATGKNGHFIGTYVGLSGGIKYTL